MKKAALFTAVVSLLFGSSLIGETNTDELTSGYNSPGRIDVKGSWDLFFTGSYVYWQPREDGLDLGYLYPAAINTAFSTQTSIYQMDFDYKSGFKVGLGTNFEHDNWVASLDYTRLHMKDHRSVSITGALADYFIMPFWNNHDNTYIISSASASWKLRYDMLSLVLTRPFYSGTCLTLNGFAGLKGGWLNQKYHIGYVDNYEQRYDIYTPYYTTARSNSWLVGPQGGCTMNCLLGAGFRFFGETSGSLLYQKLKTSLYIPYTHYWSVVQEYGATFINEKSRYGQITPNFNLSAGLGWGTYFDKNNWHFDLAASYDFNYYWDQNHMKKLMDLCSFLQTDLDMANPYGEKAKDLVLHGLTITARLDF